MADLPILFHKGVEKSSHVSVPLHAVLYFGTRYRLPEQPGIAKNHRSAHGFTSSKHLFRSGKNAEALFLSEVLCQTIKEPEPNLPLFAFIARSIQVLNIMEEGKANFHLCFLLQLCSFLGFSPNMETYRTGYFFDMLNGIFSPSRPIHTYTLDAREAEVFARLTRMDFNNLRHFKFNRGERNAILDRILTYYRLHQPDISELRSPEILRAIFD